MFLMKVCKAPEPKHGIISKVYHDQTGLFEHIQNPTLVVRYHSLIIDSASLPDCILPIAFAKDTLNGVEQEIIMGVKHVSKPLWGVQFHPEVSIQFVCIDLHIYYY